MDAFNQADAVSQVCGGFLGIVLMGVFVYTTFFRKRKKSGEEASDGSH